MSADTQPGDAQVKAALKSWREHLFMLDYNRMRTALAAALAAAPSPPAQPQDEPRISGNKIVEPVTFAIAQPQADPPSLEIRPATEEDLAFIAEHEADFVHPTLENDEPDPPSPRAHFHPSHQIEGIDPKLDYCGMCGVSLNDTQGRPPPEQPCPEETPEHKYKRERATPSPGAQEEPCGTTSTAGPSSSTAITSSAESVTEADGRPSGKPFSSPDAPGSSQRSSTGPNSTPTPAGCSATEPGAQAPSPELALELQERIREAKGLGVSSHAQPTKVQLGGVIRTVILLEEHVYKLEAALATERAAHEKTAEWSQKRAEDIRILGKALGEAEERNDAERAAREEAERKRLGIHDQHMIVHRAAEATIQELQAKLAEALAAQKRAEEDLKRAEDGEAYYKKAAEVGSDQIYKLRPEVVRLTAENAALRKSLDGAREALANVQDGYLKAICAARDIIDRTLPAEPAKAEGG